MAADPDQHLDPLRVKIDALDEQIVALLNDRARIVVEIGRLKQQNKTPIYAPDRSTLSSTFTVLAPADTIFVSKWIHRKPSASVRSTPPSST